MLAAAFAAAAAASAFGTASAGLAGRDRRRLVAFALLHGFACDQPARQPDRLRGRHQHAGRRADRRPRPRLVRRRAGARPRSTARRASAIVLLGHSRPRLPRARRRCRSPPSCWRRRASACACARSARTRPPSTPPASRSPGLRYAAVLIGGVLCGLGGAYLAIAQSAGFIPNMTAGKGFIALAALIFARWRAFRGARHLPLVRAPRRRRDPPPGRGCSPASARCRCRPCRLCPIS